MYSLTEFRANTREAFNIAEAGGDVVINRHGKLFELRLLPSTTPSKTVPMQEILGQRRPTPIAQVTNSLMAAEPKAAEPVVVPFDE